MKKTNGFKKNSTISLFTGCGGLDLGFVGGFKSLGEKYAGLDFDVKWANDVDDSSCLSFEKNFKTRIVKGDIRQILNGERSKLFDPPMPKKADVVLGGFPCQDFSLAGKRRGFKGKRGLLYQAMVAVVKKTRPKVFVAENVKGLLSVTDGQNKAIDIIKNDFEKLGYHVKHRVYNSADFGVPQARERVIIVGTNKRKKLPPFKMPDPPFSKKDWTTLRQAIGDLENDAEGAIANHYWSKAKIFPGTQGNTFVSADYIGPTMRAEHHGNIEWHWNKKRRLSAREAARIQSFPDDFIFYPSTSQAYRQIGNAVPPVMAWYIAKSIQDFLQKHSKKERRRF